jgi:hypothetical protein
MIPRVLMCLLWCSPVDLQALRIFQDTPHSITGD